MDIMTTLPEAVECAPEVGPAAAYRPRWLLIALSGVMLAIFVISAILMARSKMPWSDEGWFANPAYNLAFHGNMGTNVLEPSGHYLNAYLSGIQRRTYIVPPLYIITLAGWYRLFGFSLLATRALSLFWACVTLGALFSLVFSLTRRLWLAFLSAAITSVDFLFLWGAMDGRMDMMCTALGYAAIAAYLGLRERNLNQAIFWSHALAAAALFTHPNALVAIAALLYLTFMLDRARLRRHHLVAVGAPYFVLFLAWLPYILQSPMDFRAQFLANAAGPGSARLNALRRPWTLVSGEIGKYFMAYGSYPLWAGPIGRWADFIPVIYFAAAGVCVFRRKIGMDAGSRQLLGLALVYWTAVTFLIGLKTQNYLVLSLPLHGAILALALISLWQSHSANRVLAGFLAVNFLCMQLATITQIVRRDDYHSQYSPVAKLIRQFASEHKTVTASAAFGFEAGFDQFHDDVRLGFYSGLQPDLVVVEPLYRFWYARHAKNEPAVQKYTTELLEHSRLVQHTEVMDVYEVISRPQPAR
jgi:4-amino-4-deoxy-L-arabinose transferase-like glycosyltransferase